MLTTIALMLLILWLLGLVTTYTLSGFIHLLLVPAILLFVISFFSGAKGHRTKFYRQPSGNEVRK